MMNVELYNLPVSDLNQIDKVAMELMAAQRSGTKLAPEQLDWLDYANNVVLISSNSERTVA